MYRLNQASTVRQSSSQIRPNGSLSTATNQNQNQMQRAQTSHQAHQNLQDVNNYILHLHSACLHRYHPHLHEPSQVPQLANELIRGDNLAAPIILVTHPRWCPTCLTQRQTTLKANMLRRLRALIARFSNDIEDSVENQAKLRRECAYLAGIYQGRKHALSTPLADNESPTFVDNFGEFTDLSSVLDSLSLNQHHRDAPTTTATKNADDDPMKDILDRFDMMEVTRDEIGHEVRLVMATWEEERLGFDDGRCLQASVESAGVAEFNEARRGEILSGALM